MPPDFPSFLYEHFISISGVYSKLAREEECMRDSAQIKSVQLYNIFLLDSKHHLEIIWKA